MRDSWPRGTGGEHSLGPLTSRLEIRATVSLGNIRATDQNMTRFLLLPTTVDAGAYLCCSYASARRRRRCCGRSNWRPRRRDNHRRCGRWAALLWAAAGLCGSGALLLLDARRALWDGYQNVGSPQREGLSVIIRLAEFGQSGMRRLNSGLPYERPEQNEGRRSSPRVKETSGKRLTRSNYILAEPN